MKRESWDHSPACDRSAIRPIFDDFAPRYRNMRSQGFEMLAALVSDHAYPLLEARFMCKRYGVWDPLERAKEVVQEKAIRILEGERESERNWDGDSRSWWINGFHYDCLKILKKQKRQKPLLEEIAMSLDSLEKRPDEQAEISDCVRWIMINNKLNNHEISVLNLMIKGEKYHDIAAILGTNSERIRQIFHRLCKKLEKELGYNTHNS